MRMRTKWMWNVVVGAVALCMADALPAQDAAQPPPKPQMMAKDASPDWEVATVKPSDPNDPGGQHIRLRGQHVMLLDTTVEQFLLLLVGPRSIGSLLTNPDLAHESSTRVPGVSRHFNQPRDE